MDEKIRITYPDSEKVYLKGEIHPDVRVGMRRVTLTPTVTIEDGKQVRSENAPVYIYDTSGPYSDPDVEVDLRKGLPRLREKWIQARDVERLEGITSEYGRMRLADKTLDHLRFEHICPPYRAKAGCQVSQMYYARAGHRVVHHSGVRAPGDCRRTCRPARQHQPSGSRADDYRH